MPHNEDAGFMEGAGDGLEVMPGMLHDHPGLPGQALQACRELLLLYLRSVMLVLTSWFPSSINFYMDAHTLSVESKRLKLATVPRGSAPTSTWAFLRPFLLPS